MARVGSYCKLSRVPVTTIPELQLTSGAMSSSPCAPRSTPNIFSLPPELVEQTLILSAACGFPSSIASLAQTCRYFHSLVYQSTDHHLWREIFLTTFDDPRPLMAHLQSAGPFGPAPGLEQDQHGLVSFNWAEEFIQRLSAAKYIRKYTDTGVDGIVTPSRSWHRPATDILEQPSPLLLALRSLVSVLSTSQPFPSTPSIIDFTLTSPPAFPPIILLRSSPLPFPPAFKSLNSAWMEETLRRGYPRALTRCLFVAGYRKGESVDEEEEFERVRYTEWEATEEGRLFYKLVFLKSFIPIPNDLEKALCSAEDETPDFLRINDEAATSASETSSNSNPPPPIVIGPDSALSAEQQLAAARSLARSRVYNLRYLTQDRCWGPYMPLPRRPKSNLSTRGRINPPKLSRADDDIDDHIPNGDDNIGDIDGEPSTSANGDKSESWVDVINQANGTDDNDSEYQPGEEDGQNSSDENEDDDQLLSLLPLMTNNGIDFGNEEIHDTFIFPPPHRLIPDYAFLSAARLIIESNLRDMLRDNPGDTAAQAVEDATLGKVVEALGCLELVRMGGSPDFWKGAWKCNSAEREGEGAERPYKGPVKDKGKAKDNGSDVEEVDGWDWAGVAGEWKRTICWLDYRDLLLHNLGSFGFSDSDLEETIRIFPLTLRVTGYSKAPSPGPADSSSPAESLIWKLPIIHIEGESTGSDLDDQAVRHVKGTVRVIGDGAIRWSMTSSHPGSNDPEWVTEGIQIGSIGSAIGILGMWTGAEHVRTDPLGPFWAWKVAGECMTGRM